MDGEWVGEHVPRTSTSRPTGDTRSYAGGQTYAGVDGETILEMVTSEMLHWVKHGDGRTLRRFGEPGEPGDPLVPVRQGQGLCTDLLIQPEETQVGRNRGAGGAAEPRQLALGVGLSGL